LKDIGKPALKRRLPDMAGAVNNDLFFIYFSLAFFFRGGFYFPK
jgi:hypothetical protein